MNTFTAETIGLASNILAHRLESPECAGDAADDLCRLVKGFRRRGEEFIIDAENGLNETGHADGIKHVGAVRSAHLPAYLDGMRESAKIATMLQFPGAGIQGSSNRAASKTPISRAPRSNRRRMNAERTFRFGRSIPRPAYSAVNNPKCAHAPRRY